LNQQLIQLLFLNGERFALAALRTYCLNIWIKAELYFIIFPIDTTASTKGLRPCKLSQLLARLPIAYFLLF